MDELSLNARISSNDFSRVCVCVCVLGGGRAGGVNVRVLVCSI